MTEHPKLRARRLAVEKAARKKVRDELRLRDIRQRQKARLRERYSLAPKLQQSVDFAERHGRLPTNKDIEPPPSAA